jgi:Kae1-associated kinase Bud32
MKFINRGAEAKIYADKLFGKPSIIKRREAKKYRVKELDEKLRKTRTMTEARILLRARSSVPVPRVFNVGKFDIWMEFLKGKLLRDTKAPGKKVYRQVGQMLAALHKLQIAHGDFTPANIIVSGDNLWVIDFGLASISPDVEEYAIDLLLIKKAVGPHFKDVLGGYTAFGQWKPVVERMKEIAARARYAERNVKTKG